jgi:putative tricarboxylic transport membrane protein
VIAALIVAGAAALLYITTTFETVPDLLSQNIGPEVFPQLVLIAIILLALGLPVEHRYLQGGAARLGKARSERVGRSGWATAALLVVIGALMPLAGTLVTLFLICLALPLLWGERRLRVVVPFAVLFPLAVKLVFETLLEVPFEPGLLAALGG